jgi:pimeloyl-[acyl-carrier protein] methyl ester esterase
MRPDPAYPTLVFLHGWGLHGGIWAETAAALEEEWPTLTPDLPGYGSAPAVTVHGASAVPVPEYGGGRHERFPPTSTFPPQAGEDGWARPQRVSIPAPYTAESLADALAAAHPGPCLLCGWSMGGMVAQAWAARHPAQVRGLVLVGTSPAFVNRPGWDRGMAPEVLAAFAGELAGDYRATLLRFLALQARGGDAARGVIARLRESVFARGDPDPAVLAAGLELLRTVDLRGQVCQVVCPTLVIHGGYDTLCPAAAGEWLAERIPDARLALNPRAAHAPFLSHPGWFLEQLRGFLRGLEP